MEVHLGLPWVFLFPFCWLEVDITGLTGADINIIVIYWGSMWDIIWE